MLKLSKSLLWVFMTIVKCRSSGLAITNHLSGAIYGMFGGKIELWKCYVSYI